MVGNDLGHEHRDLVRGVKLARLFSRIGSKHADEVLINKAQHVVALPAIHRDVFDELNQLRYGLSLFGGRVA